METNDAAFNSPLAALTTIKEYNSGISLHVKWVPRSVPLTALVA